MDADAVERRHGVGRRVLDARDSSSSSTPSPTRGASSVSMSSAPNGNSPAGDHAGEAVEDLDVDPLELARPAAHRRHRLPRSSRRPWRPSSAPGCTGCATARVAGRACSRRRRSGRGARPGRRAAARPRRRPGRPGPRGTGSGWWSAASGRGRRTSSRCRRRARTAAGRRSRSRPAGPTPRSAAGGGRARCPRPWCTTGRSRRAMRHLVTTAHWTVRGGGRGSPPATRTRHRRAGPAGRPRARPRRAARGRRTRW